MQLEEAASQLETYLNQRFVHALVRQGVYKDHNPILPNEVVVLLTAKSKMDKAVKALSDEGYESNASVGPELTLIEGQPIIVRFRGNISDTDGRPVKFT